MKWVNIFLGLMFVLFAGLQYNDTDPYIWVPIYLYAAVICFMAANNNYNKWMILIGLGVYVVYITNFIPGLESWYGEHHHENIAQSMKAEKPWIEAAREFFGLLIIIVALIFQYIRMKRQTVKN